MDITIKPLFVVNDCNKILVSWTREARPPVEEVWNVFAGWAFQCVVEDDIFTWFTVHWVASSKLTYNSALLTHTEHEIQKYTIMVKMGLWSGSQKITVYSKCGTQPSLVTRSVNVRHVAMYRFGHKELAAVNVVTGWLHTSGLFSHFSELPSDCKKWITIFWVKLEVGN